MYRKKRVLTHFVILCIEFHAAKMQIRFPYGAALPTKLIRNVPFCSTLISAFSRHAVVTPAVRASAPRHRSACSMLPPLPNYRSFLLRTHIRTQKHTHTQSHV